MSSAPGPPHYDHSHPFTGIVNRLSIPTLNPHSIVSRGMQRPIGAADAPLTQHATISRQENYTCAATPSHSLSTMNERMSAFIEREEAKQVRSLCCLSHPIANPTRCTAFYSCRIRRCIQLTPCLYRVAKCWPNAKGNTGRKNHPAVEQAAGHQQTRTFSIGFRSLCTPIIFWP